MTLRKSVLSAVAVAAVAAAMTATVPSGARAAVEAGGLNCHSPGGIGFIVGAVLNFDCVFVPSRGGPPQHYVAVVRRVGLDLGVTQNVTMGWAVFAPTAFVHYGDLAGNYGGVQATATVGVGLGANALVGGSNNAFALQPISGQAQTGLSVSAGLAGLELRAASPYERFPHYRRHHHRHH
jgi:Protein of unknown function (DUF992)